MDPVTYNTTTSVDTGAFGLFFGAYSIFWLVVAVLTIVGVWKTFAKAGLQLFLSTTLLLCCKLLGDQSGGLFST